MLARFTAVMLFVATIMSSFAAAAGPEMPDLEKVVKSLNGIPTNDSARYQQAGDRYLRFIGAPPGLSFNSSTATKSADPEQAARAYFLENAKAFGSGTARQGFKSAGIEKSGDRTHVRLQQTYDGVPVFGAQVNAQIGPDGGIKSLLSDIMRDTRLLDEGRVGTTPTIGQAAARQMALLAARNVYPASALEVRDDPVLYIYHPSVLGDSGPTHLVWVVSVICPDSIEIAQRVLIDAHSAATVLQYSLTETLLHRHIYDAFGASDEFGYIRRQEGEAPSQIADADNAYDFLGDTYNFYFNQHGRDSIDGKGMDLNATVRLNMENAGWSDYYQWMFFGTGYTVDDVTAHELTHGVTSTTSNLIYYFQSGAINESLSDIWGEFIDLTNGKGNDSPAVRWLMGEEVPGDLGVGIRDMQNPENFGDPDRFSDYMYLPDWYDNGGVHFNSGIGNKLAYLLTDGDSFNGYVILGIGIPKVAALFYEAQVHLLVPGSDYADLGTQLVQAAYDLDWTSSEIRNVKLAAQAVEILPPEPVHPLQHLRATAPIGKSRVDLTWSNPNNTVSPTITLVRRTDRFPESPTDVQASNPWTKSSVDESLSDAEVTVGQEYFYGAFFGSGSSLQRDFARATAGGGEVDYLSESFIKIRGNAVDLAFSQMTFDPVVDLNAANASGETTGYMNYSNYVVTVKKDVYQLPSSTDGATYVKPLEDAFFTYTLRAPVPFFGKDTSTLGFAPNGYVATSDDMATEAAVSTVDDYLFPSMETHFDFPKIAFLFSDLSPTSGGVVWIKDLEDRFVLTYERVPEFTSNRGNTVQLELFYGGRIRITWLELNAEDAIVGLSDGNGIPFDPSTGKVKESDLSGQPQSQAGSVILEPVSPVFVGELEPIEFSVFANAPTGQNPVFTFSKVGVAGEPIDLPAGAAVTPASGAAARSAVFRWTPTLAQGSYHTFRATFTSGTKVASQDIRVVVSNTSVPPVLTTAPMIIPDPPQDGETLRVLYNYSQVEAIPEGASVIRWLKNGVLVQGLTNRLEVPEQYTLPGQVWRVIVTPVTYGGLAGIPYWSEEVTIQPDTQPDINKDGKVNAIDVQLVVNSVLGLGSRALNADVDSDYTVNARDVQLLINAVIGRR